MQTLNRDLSADTQGTFNAVCSDGGVIRVQPKVRAVSGSYIATTDNYPRLQRALETDYQIRSSLWFSAGNRGNR